MRMDFLSDNENLLNNFPPRLRGNFEELFLHGKIGVVPFTLRDISFTKQYTDNGSIFYYWYTLKIPYAGKRLSWELIFNPEDTSFAPDFNFNDDNFYMSHDLDLVIENIPSLVNWNVNNRKSLISVLQEFLNLYKKQQIERLYKENIYSQLSLKYQQFVEEIGAQDDVEIYLESTSAHLIFNIKVDTSSLPEYCQFKEENQSNTLLNPGQDTCILKVSFIKLDASRVNTSLQLSPRLEQVFGPIKSLHIPVYNNSLVEYINKIKKLIQDQVKRIQQHYSLKKQFMNCLCTRFSDKIIEFDSETFNQAAFLCEIDGYHCIVHVKIGNLFPQEKPTILLHSLYCVLPGKPCIEELKDLPYSPRWLPDVMLDKIIAYLVEIVSEFKNHTH